MSCGLWAVAYREFENKESRVFLDATDQGGIVVRPRKAENCGVHGHEIDNFVSRSCLKEGVLLIQEASRLQRFSCGAPSLPTEGVGPHHHLSKLKPFLEFQQPRTLAAFISACLRRILLWQQTVLQTLRQRLGSVHL